MTDTPSKSLLFFGPSGAGKGTQVKLLMDKLNALDDRGIVYVEMGALLREMVAEGTYSGNLTKQIIEQGALMPGLSFALASSGSQAGQFLQLFQILLLPSTMLFLKISKTRYLLFMMA
jgi:adenylate kinase family enzyme